MDDAFLLSFPKRLQGPHLYCGADGLATAMIGLHSSGPVYAIRSATFSNTARQWCGPYATRSRRVDPNRYVHCLDHGCRLRSDWTLRDG